MRPVVWLAAMVLLLGSVSAATAQNVVELRDVGRLQGWRDNALVGYGLVTGLTGTGDTPRNPVTQRAVANVVGRLGSNIPTQDVRSRNVAAVMVTATLPPSANVGDRIDVTVTSIGDARSLSGGVLLMTPLIGADQQAYALAQGALVAGGYHFSSELNSEQRNSPTAAVISNGATIERRVEAQVLGADGELSFVLREPSFTTAVSVADAVNAADTGAVARVADAGTVRIDVSSAPDVFRTIARIERLPVSVSPSARIVINERTGTVVAGGGVRISSVSISQGDIRVSVRQREDGIAPVYYGGVGDIPGLTVRNTSVTVEEGRGDALVHLPDTTVGDLMEALRRAGVDTRGQLSILQAIRAAGALHAEIIVQ